MDVSLLETHQGRQLARERVAAMRAKAHAAQKIGPLAARRQKHELRKEEAVGQQPRSSNLTSTGDVPNSFAVAERRHSTPGISPLPLRIASQSTVGVALKLQQPPQTSSSDSDHGSVLSSGYYLNNWEPVRRDCMGAAECHTTPAVVETDVWPAKQSLLTNTRHSNRAVVGHGSSVMVWEQSVEAAYTTEDMETVVTHTRASAPSPDSWRGSHIVLTSSHLAGASSIASVWPKEPAATVHAAKDDQAVAALKRATAPLRDSRRGAPAGLTSSHLAYASSITAAAAGGSCSVSSSASAVSINEEAGVEEVSEATSTLPGESFTSRRRPGLTLHAHHGSGRGGNGGGFDDSMPEDEEASASGSATARRHPPSPHMPPMLELESRPVCQGDALAKKGKRAHLPLSEVSRRMAAVVAVARQSALEATSQEELDRHRLYDEELQELRRTCDKWRGECGRLWMQVEYLQDRLFWGKEQVTETLATCLPTSRESAEGAEPGCSGGVGAKHLARVAAIAAQRAACARLAGSSPSGSDSEGTARGLSPAQRRKMAWAAERAAKPSWRR